MTIAITAKGIRKNFRLGSETIEVLRGLDLELKLGRSLSIRGASGCGKTTLLNIISGLEQPDAGDLTWQGESVVGMSNRKLAERRSAFCALVFQSYFLVPELNALENVLLPARIARKPLAEARTRALELLERVGLSARLNSLPGTLSGGERQRVAVARALINQPCLVLADEPTGNLDEHTSEEVLQLLLQVTAEEKASLILVTHNREHAALTQEQTVLHEGILNGEF
jgi:ABC-type lipoprotein export system ATPase subunit|tara:strand:- start:6320 stop:7000 length:681 start_codon:yes stop_codon:yes gene_type:complete